MLIEKRLSGILELVEKNRSVTVAELMQKLNASESTIRRDLNTLDAQGRLVKVHGGAIAAGSVYSTIDTEVSAKQDMNREEKLEIAKYAASLIRPGDFVYLDAGTTTELMIDFIQQRQVVFVTNAILHAKKLSGLGIRTYILGGEFKPVTEAIVGEEAILNLSKFNFTKGFFGSNGVNRVTGFSTPELNEAMLKKKAMERSRECYVLSDVSKFSQIAPVTFAEFDDATVITTKIPDSSYEDCRNIVEVSKL
ncbi:MAG: DeoR/GlpR transcriptional regulator [Clostridiales bacterium]|nr:DeoR/GlpR transcriptional regulator [Clostridiales bacterium]